MMSAIRDQIVSFLREIGLVVHERTLSEPTILPGITVDNGALVIDTAKLLYPGDLLHEAGHLAVIPAAERALLGANVGTDGGLEMAAIGWSYAACMHLGLSADVVFHPDGYREGSSNLIENFSRGMYLGVPILMWRGLAKDPKSGADGYPVMQKWLCD